VTTPASWVRYAANALRREQHPDALDYWDAIAPFIDPEQAWFWTKEWQAGERESRADRDAGRTVTFESVDEAIAWLQRDEP
jgi:hypothetical protein